MTDMVFQKNLSVKLLQRRFFRPAKLHVVRALHASCLSVFVPYMPYLPGTFTYPPVLITLHSFVHSRPFLFCVFYVFFTCPVLLEYSFINNNVSSKTSINLAPLLKSLNFKNIRLLGKAKLMVLSLIVTFRNKLPTNQIWLQPYCFSEVCFYKKMNWVLLAFLIKFIWIFVLQAETKILAAL